LRRDGGLSGTIVGTLNHGTVRANQERDPGNVERRIGGERHGCYGARRRRPDHAMERPDPGSVRP